MKRLNHQIHEWFRNFVLPAPSNLKKYIYFFKKKKIYLALEGLAVVVNRVTCSVPVPGSTLYVHACHPRGALPAPGFAGCPVGRGE